MLRLLSHAYRCLGNGFAIACIFVGGGLLATTVLPITNLIPGNRQKRSRYIIHLTFRFYIGMVQWLRLIRLEVEGREELNACSGKIVVANHPSLLDVVILMALIPNTQCIIKSELWNNRYLSGLMRRSGYIRNDLDPERLIAACQASILAGDNIIIFPEGTRTRPGVLPRLQRGFANIATLTGAEVQLMLITCTPPSLMKGQPWWSIPERPSLFRLVVGHCVNTESFKGYRSRASRQLTMQVESYYAEKLANV